MSNTGKSYSITENPPVSINFKYVHRQTGYREQSICIEQIIKKILKISYCDKATQSGIEILASNIAGASRYCINLEELSSFIKVNIAYCERESAEIAKAINEIRYSLNLLKPICDSDYHDVFDFKKQASNFLVEIGIWEMKDGSIDSWDLEWDLEFYPILWRARYIHSFDEFLDLYQTLCTYWLGINHRMINRKYDPEKIWKKISSWKSIKWTVNP